MIIKSSPALEGRPGVQAVFPISGTPTGSDLAWLLSFQVISIMGKRKLSRLFSTLVLCWIVSENQESIILHMFVVIGHTWSNHWRGLEYQSHK